MAIRISRFFVFAALGACILPFTTPGVQADLTLQCALPYTHGKPGKDCGGKHRVEFSLSGDNGGAVVQAQMLALDADGNILGTLPVENNDEAHIKSRVDPEDYRLKATKKGLDIDAPIPLLSVTAREGDEVVHAYCSNVPYLKLYQPTGQVSNGGDTVKVLMAATGLDIPSLQILVDGTDILAELGIDPAIDLPHTFPGNVGTAMIGGENVTISDLVIEIADIELLSSNTISFAMDGLPAGGHIIYVDGEREPGKPIPTPKKGGAKCYLDDMEDVGQFAVFGVDITHPTDQSIVNLVPTPVSGVVKHGLPIASVKLNGAELDLTGMTYVPGNGMTTADQYEYIIDEELPQTDLRADLDNGNQPLGTLDRGANDLTADAQDDLGNRAFDNVIFAVGNVQSPALQSPLASFDVLTSNAMHYNAKEKMTPIVISALEETELAIENAFVVGLTEEGIQTLIDQKCPAAGQAFADSVKNKIGALPKFVKTLHDPLDFTCSCDPDVNINITGVEIDPNQISCPVNFVEDKIEVTISLPDVGITSTATGHCGSCDFAETETNVSITAETDITGLSFSFDITEGQFLGNPVPSPVFVEGTSSVHTSGGIDTPCFISDVCEFTIEAFVTIFTFGQVDLELTPSLDITNVTEFDEAISASEPDPIDLGDVKVDETKVEEFNQASLSGALASVEITPQGFLATLDGNFQTLAVDPDVKQTPGAVVEEPAAPTMQIAGASDATVLLSVDTINQLFASMSESGGLKTQCLSSGLTLNNVLPVNCDNLDGALASGYCHGVRGDTDCESIFQGTGIGDAIKQGVCHGVRDDDCTSIPFNLELERTTCSNTPPLNLTGTDPVMFCSQQNMPPQFLLVDNAATPNAVETAVRLNDLSVSIVVDRGDDGLGGNGIVDLPVPGCFGSESSIFGDCALYSTCLDLNLETTSSITNEGSAVKECPPGVPGFVTQVDNFSLLVRQQGVVCGAPQETADDELVGTSSEDQTVDLIRDKADTFTPPVCVEGLNLGGFVTLQNPKIIAVETNGDPDTQEYIGITGAVAPLP